MRAEYHVLGFSPSTVSMLLESVTRIHDGGATVNVITNLSVTSDADYEVDTVALTLIDHEEWDFSRPLAAVLGVYRPEIKKAVYQFFERHHEVGLDSYVDLVHPLAEIASTATSGAGLMMQPYSVLAPFCRMGDLVSVNRLASIGHHTVIGDRCTFNPGVAVAGGCSIGDDVTVGMGANIVDGIDIGLGAVVGAGALVTKDVPARSLVVGVPARVVRDLAADDGEVAGR